MFPVIYKSIYKAGYLFQVTYKSIYKAGNLLYGTIVCC